MTAQHMPVEATHIMMFARAIGDPNPAYADGRVAPPTFTMARAQFDPDNPLRPKPGEKWFGSGRTPSGEPREGGGVLHAEQRFTYHAPLHAGMNLDVTEKEGKTWDKESKRAGLLRFTERITEFRDAATGELVVTTTMVVVKPERPVQQD